MTSKRNRANVAPADSADKRVIGGRATREQRVLIDTARARLQEDRATFIVTAAVERARRVLVEERVA